MAVVIVVASVIIVIIGDILIVITPLDKFLVNNIHIIQHAPHLLDY
jgi:hypothetical protein